MDTIIKYFTTIFFVLYMMAAFVWPTYRTWKQTGVNPLTFGNADTAHDFVGLWFKIVVGLIPVNLLLLCFGKELYAYTLPVWYLEFSALKIAGISLCLVSLLWTIIAQQQMGNSWRIGIDETHKTIFVNTGLFGLSRNPIFLGMTVTMAGVFCILPNALSLLTLVSGSLLMGIQIRLEEEFLTKQFGPEYERYKERVRRWI